MKTIKQLTDNASLRLLSSMTRNELNEIIIEASKQAFESAREYPKDLNHSDATGYKYQLVEQYLEEIEA